MGIRVIPFWSAAGDTFSSGGLLNAVLNLLLNIYSTDDILKCIFLNANVWISIEISLKFVPHLGINDIVALI